MVKTKEEISVVEKAIRQARGYFRRNNEQGAHGDAAAKDRLKRLMAENPCRGCGGFGHWSKDPGCPRNKAKSANSANVAAKEITGASASTSTFVLCNMP